MERDALDFGRMNIPRLFIKLFVPTLLGLLFGALLNLADGIFVGRGVGSDALAAVNIAAPLFSSAITKASSVPVLPSFSCSCVASSLSSQRSFYSLPLLVISVCGSLFLCQNC